MRYEKKTVEARIVWELGTSFTRAGDHDFEKKNQWRLSSFFQYIFSADVRSQKAAHSRTECRRAFCQTTLYYTSGAAPLVNIARNPGSTARSIQQTTCPIIRSDTHTFSTTKKKKNKNRRNKRRCRWKTNWREGEKKILSRFLEMENSWFFHTSAILDDLIGSRLNNMTLFFCFKMKWINTLTVYRAWKLTFWTVRGAAKSMPPCSRKPHGWLSNLDILIEVNWAILV